MLIFLPAAITAAVSLGEILGTGVGIIGIGAGIRGIADCRKSAEIQNAARDSYLLELRRIRRYARRIQKRLEQFGRLKLEIYSGIIREAVESLSRFRGTELTPFRNTETIGVYSIAPELDSLERACIKAGDILEGLSLGIAQVVQCRSVYGKRLPSLIAAGAFGLNPLSTVFPAITGLFFGAKAAGIKTAALRNAAKIEIRREKLQAYLAQLRAVSARVREGEQLISALSGKIRTQLCFLDNVSGFEITESVSGHINMTVLLLRALKSVIEVDIVSGNGTLTKGSGVLFRKIHREYTADDL
ncbi:hypothetical protein K7I13_03565 [Brucepastera parasyntrophica]|uniref:hypothetical protein n=1 Tax=Brucepastera parasyntrophica TaxID=2880008 RepID=UPI00210ED637|nr:hypothetical protein [Brucepastera parasyntrophica]ULQ60398.1 hypothetical protein K7I13_03565 [Brucepastera parasyntrophica]